MSEERWFYQSDQQWQAIRERLKQTPCPHCKVVGMLICHGYLTGYDDQSPQRKTVRARRIFCSNRHARRGCGRTFSVWIASKIRRRTLTTSSLWKFLQMAVTGTMTAAIHALRSPLCDQTLQRIWKRFTLAQSKIRTALLERCPPPQIHSPRPQAQVLAHLKAAFPNSDCPITDFQVSMRTFFL